MGQVSAKVGDLITSKATNNSAEASVRCMQMIAFTTLLQVGFHFISPSSRRSGPLLGFHDGFKVDESFDGNKGFGTWFGPWNETKKAT